jgi:hypothetical protein
LDSGVGLIAIPSLLADLDATGVTSEVAIANIVPKPGFTDFVIYIYDQNGLLDYICQKLNEKQVEYIDLNTWGYINNGFKGSAIISAFFWEHDVFAGDGRFLRNLVGLGAVAVERSKTFLGQDIPGDEAAGARGIPFRQSDIEDEEFSFGFMGENPACPGVPIKRPKPGDCDPDQFDQDVSFNMNVSESIALVQPGLPTSQCASGAGWVNRSWNPRSEEHAVSCCGAFIVTGIMDNTTIAPYPGYPIVNILLYSEPRAPAAPFCDNLIDSSTNNVAGSFSRMFQQNGDSYTFLDHPSTDPVVLPANDPHYWNAHVSASFDSGTVDMHFDYE